MVKQSILSIVGCVTIAYAGQMADQQALYESDDSVIALVAQDSGAALQDLLIEGMLSPDYKFRSDSKTLLRYCIEQAKPACVEALMSVNASVKLDDVLKALELVDKAHVDEKRLSPEQLHPPLTLSWENSDHIPTASHSNAFNRARKREKVLQVLEKKVDKSLFPLWDKMRTNVIVCAHQQ